VQERSRRTHRRILDAALRLLEQRGIEGLNTNDIARVAGVNIGAVYKYFPNKHAILALLARELNDRQTELAIEFVKQADASVSWQDILRGAIDVMIEGTRSAPALVALQSAMQANPELKALYRESNEAVGRLLLRTLQDRGFVFPARRRRLIALCLGEAVSALMDLSVAGGKRFDPQVIEEMKRMQVAYLGSYLDD
jgi:AcrR family transcriptional regulator